MSAPKGFVKQLEGCKEELMVALDIIDDLRGERQELYKVIRNTADSLSDGEDLAATFRVVRQLDDLLTAARNDGVYDDN